MTNKNNKNKNKDNVQFVYVTHMISIYSVLTGEKKPKAVKKVKAEAVSDDSGEDDV